MTNNLESKLTEQQRPSFLKRIARYAGIGALSLLAIACDKNKPTTPSGPGTTPTPVTQRVQVYNSNGTNLGAANFDGTVGQNMTITYADLATKGINTQRSDPNYFVIRDQNTTRVGNYITHTTNGTITFQPTNVLERVIWLMNNTNGANYQGAWESGLGRNGIRGNNRYATVIRLTAQNAASGFNVVDGDMTTIINGLNLLNQAWNVNGVQYASLTYDPNGTTGSIKAGIGTHNNAPNAGGYHTGDSFVVRPELLNQQQAINITTEEAIEALLNYDDLHGRDTKASLFANVVSDQTFSPVGNDYVRFGVLMTRP